jgi:hypothetical protein
LRELPSQRRIVNQRTEKRQLGNNWHAPFRQVIHALRGMPAEDSAVPLSGALPVFSDDFAPGKPAAKILSAECRRMV